MKMGFPGGSVVKNPLANAGDVGWIPGREDPLEKQMATHSSILAWRIPWTEEPGRLRSMGLQESDMTERLITQHIIYISSILYFSLRTNV